MSSAKAKKEDAEVIQRLRFVLFFEFSFYFQRIIKILKKNHLKAPIFFKFVSQISRDEWRLMLRPNFREAVLFDLIQQMKGPT